MEPYLGEIHMFAGDYEPENYAFCDGRLLQISQYGGLYSILGTQYGGDGRTTFALPDLRGRVPVGVGVYTTLGAMPGSEGVSLPAAKIPAHSHGIQMQIAPGIKTTTDQGDVVVPDAECRLATGFSTDYQIEIENYRTPETGTEDVSLGGMSIGGGVSLANAGQGLPHDNMQPGLVVNFIIAIEGTYPLRS